MAKAIIENGTAIAIIQNLEIGSKLKKSNVPAINAEAAKTNSVVHSAAKIAFMRVAPVVVFRREARIADAMA